jgi:hypothetical protein
VTTPEISTEVTSPIERVLEQLQQIEVRLNRLLAAGWRNAGDDLAELTSVAAGLTELGLSEVAARLHAVAAAADPAEGVRAAGLALAACRLLRVRLAPDVPAPGDWAPVGLGKRSTATTRLLPLARFALADGEVWSCLWFKGGYAAEWVLVEPPDVSDGMGAEDAGSWFTRLVVGRLRWRARLPLGATGDVERCALEGATWEVPPDEGTQMHPLAVFVQSIRRGRLAEDAWVGSDRLKLVPYDPADLDAYAWPDSAASAAIAASPWRIEHGWALVWTAGGATPIALISAAPARSGLGALRDALTGRPAPQIVHLVPGLPSDEISQASRPT